MPSTVNYAGFFSRLIAFMIDMFIMSISYKVLDKLLYIDMNLQVPMLITLWIYISYSVYKWKGTIGYKIVGIVVLDIASVPLTFTKSILRATYVIFEFLYVFYIFTFLGSLPDEYGNIVFFLPLLLFAPIYIFFFNKRKQYLHDYLAKSIIVDKVYQVVSEESVEQVKNKSIKQLSSIRKVFRVIATVAILIPIVYGIFYMTVMYMAFGGKGKTSDIPDKSIAKTVDYNHTKIDFYKSELEKASANFIEAESMYDILHGRVKKDLSLNCIRFFLQKEGNEDWLKEGRAYKSNARNKYANTVERVKKAKKNADYMGHHFYDFDLNDVHEIEDEIADMWDINANKNTCEKMLSSNKMYDMFIVKYIKNREDTKNRYTFDLTREKDRSQRRFLKRSIDQISVWLSVLYAKHPDYLVQAKKHDAYLQSIIDTSNKKIKAKKEAESDRLYKVALEREKDPIFAAIDFNKNKILNELLLFHSNLEVKNKSGDTPLFFAIHQKNNYALTALLKHGANPNIVDANGVYTPLSWAAGENYLQIVKILLANNVDVNYQFNKSETPLTMAAKGCRNFEMVQVLLDNGADPDLTDTYQKSTRTGLSRYCSDKDNYNKMMKLIANKSSFFSKFF